MLFRLLRTFKTLDEAYELVRSSGLLELEGRWLGPLLEFRGVAVDWLMGALGMLPPAVRDFSLELQGQGKEELGDYRFLMASLEGLDSFGVYFGEVGGIELRGGDAHLARPYFECDFLLPFDREMRYRPTRYGEGMGVEGRCSVGGDIVVAAARREGFLVDEERVRTVVEMMIRAPGSSGLRAEPRIVGGIGIGLGVGAVEPDSGTAQSFFLVPSSTDLVSCGNVFDAVIECLPGVFGWRARLFCERARIEMLLTGEVRNVVDIGYGGTAARSILLSRMFAESIDSWRSEVSKGVVGEGQLFGLVESLRGRGYERLGIGWATADELLWGLSGSEDAGVQRTLEWNSVEVQEEKSRVGVYINVGYASGNWRRELERRLGGRLKRLG